MYVRLPTCRIWLGRRNTTPRVTFRDGADPIVGKLPPGRELSARHVPTFISLLHVFYYVSQQSRGSVGVNDIYVGMITYMIDRSR